MSVIRGIIRNGVIYPRGPLPKTWRNGQLVEVRLVPTIRDDVFVRIEESSKQVSEEDWKALKTALEEIELESKQQMRQEMGLE
jgi:predicted DNA-binding antitoxin AbrB/MazE fold protein